MFSFNADNFKSLMAVFYDVLKNSNKIITSPMTYDQEQSPLIDRLSTMTTLAGALCSYVLR